MALSHEGVGSKIPAKINTYMLNRAELLITLCYETPCTAELRPTDLRPNFEWTTFIEGRKRPSEVHFRVILNKPSGELF